MSEPINQRQLKSLVTVDSHGQNTSLGCRSSGWLCMSFGFLQQLGMLQELLEINELLFFAIFSSSSFKEEIIFGDFANDKTLIFRVFLQFPSLQLNSIPLFRAG